MSNVKSIQVTGSLPFDAHEHLELQPFLAAFTSPVLGLKLAYYGEPSLVQNERGGKTAMYRFVVAGTEAVSRLWVNAFCAAVVKAGGEVAGAEVLDLEYAA
jgi:hypothetical protein